VVEGPDAGQRLLVQGTGTRHLVGSAQACALRLVDTAVSRRHFAAWIEGDGLRIRDLDSTNGLFVGNVRVIEAEVGERARIRIGGTVLEIHVRDEAPETTPARSSFGRLVGASPAMRRIYPYLEEVARGGAPVLIEGEAGTGKELLAEVLHEQGPLQAAPFEGVDGGGSDIDAMLFGPPRGRGLLDRPGTVLVRDVCALPLETQRRLAQTLAQRAIAPVDGSAPRALAARLIVTSRRDVDLEVQRGRFDEALAAMIGRVRIELPPLRFRDGDVRLLVRFFCRRFDVPEERLSPERWLRLEARRWHGNVRELEAAVAQLALGAEEPGAEVELLGPPDTPLGDIAERLLAADLPLVQARTWLGEAFDRRYLEKVLADNRGNVSRAAARSGVARRYFQKLKTKHGLDGAKG